VGGAAARAVLRSAVVACIGPTTASAAREAGLEVIEPGEYTAQALAEALAHHFHPAPGARS
jgi:uroporphyrinogen-III synthase